MRRQMGVAVVAILCLVAACDGRRPPAAAYACGPGATTDNAGQGAEDIADVRYRLREAQRGDSMGAPAQSVAYRLLDASDGSVVVSCARDFLKGTLVCSRRLGDSTEIAFRFDRTTGEYRIHRPADGEGPGEVGRCIPR